MTERIDIKGRGEKCSESVWGNWHSYPCSKRAVVRIGEHNYCTIHDPDYKAKKKAKRERENEEKEERKQRQRRLSVISQLKEEGYKIINPNGEEI